MLYIHFVTVRGDDAVPVDKHVVPHNDLARAVADGRESWRSMEATSRLTPNWRPIIGFLIWDDRRIVHREYRAFN